MNDIDILSIHNEILNNFNSKKQQIAKYKTYLENISNTLKLYIYQIIKVKLQKSQNYFTNKINDIENDISYNYYIMDTTDIIEKYKKILAKPIKISFMGKAEADTGEKSQIIKKYIIIARKYKNNINFDNNKSSIKIICDNCGNNENFDILDQNYICMECGNILDVLVTHSSYKDIERVNLLLNILMIVKYILEIVLINFKVNKIQLLIKVFMMN